MRQLWVVLTITFLGFFGLSMPCLIFPALFLNPSFSIIGPDSNYALLLGITLAAYPLGQFIGSPILGSLSDDYGRKRLLVISLFLSAICNLFTGLAIEQKQLALLILSRFVGGLMEGNIAIARALAADIATIPKQESFGKINAASSIAYLLGPLLGGVMAEGSASSPFYFICFLFLCLAALSMALLENDTKTPQKLNYIRRFSDLFSNKQLRLLMITSTIFTLAVDIFYEFGPVYLTVKWTLGPADLVSYNSVLCLALAAGNGWLSSYISARFSIRASYLCSVAGFVLFLLGVVLTESPMMMMALFVLSGLVIGTAVTLITVQISNSALETVQGEVMGVQLSLRVLGDALICLLGGALLLISSKLILILAAATALCSLAYYRSAQMHDHTAQIGA